MNKARNVSAIRRNISYLEDEMKRIETMVAAGEPTVIVFPEMREKYVAELSSKLVLLREELSRAEGDVDDPQSE